MLGDGKLRSVGGVRSRATAAEGERRGQVSACRQWRGNGRAQDRATTGGCVLGEAQGRNIGQERRALEGAHGRGGSKEV